MESKKIRSFKRFLPARGIHNSFESRLQKARKTLSASKSGSPFILHEKRPPHFFATAVHFYLFSLFLKVILKLFEKVPDIAKNF